MLAVIGVWPCRTCQVSGCLQQPSPPCCWWLAAPRPLSSAPPPAAVRRRTRTQHRCCAAGGHVGSRSLPRVSRARRLGTSRREVRCNPFPLNMFGCKPIISQDRRGTTMTGGEANLFVPHSAAPRWQQGGGAGGRGTFHENLCFVIRCRLGTHAEDLVV